MAVIQCINAGLVPDGKQAAIIPFKDTATLVPMIEGQADAGAACDTGDSAGYQSGLRG